MLNHLFFGDNLDVLREHVGDNTVDLVYLDPPFNSNSNYNVLFKAPHGDQSQSQIRVFEDTWEWGNAAELAFTEILASGRSDVTAMVRAMRTSIGDNAMMAYIVMMSIRLIELQRKLKRTGTLYLHCDPTASHYLKLILDAIFGPMNFGNELIWKRQNAKGLASTRFARNHDVILRYTKSDQWTWNSQYAAYDPEYIGQFYKHRDADGRLYSLADLTNPNKNRPNLTYEFLGVTRVWRWTKERMQKAYEEGMIVQSRSGAIPRLKRYLDEQEGAPVDDVWLDIPPVQSQAQERLGYPTQKPVALLERIIGASSNPGDLVLDPFCGCGTTVHASQKLERRWTGIDITPLAISLIERRLKDAFPDALFAVHGIPKDLDGARELARRDKHLFQLWAVNLIDGHPHREGKKGADGGIDGRILFRVDSKTTKAAIISVKGGAHVGVDQIRELQATMENAGEPMGVFVTLTPPTAPMKRLAAAAGFYDTGSQRVPRIQILTVEELLSGTNRARIPFGHQESFKRAKRERANAQTTMPLD